MKWSFASVGIIMLGLFGIVIIMLFNDITVTNEQDYFTLKDAMEASMLEAVDAAYYRLTGKVKISQEKFVENFTRRFTETSTFGQGNYGITFYQISEYPPKASVVIYDKTSGYNIYTYTNDVETTQTDIVNALSGILEGKDNTITYKTLTKTDAASLTVPVPPYAIRNANPYASNYGRYLNDEKTTVYYDGTEHGSYYTRERGEYGYYYSDNGYSIYKKSKNNLVNDPNNPALVKGYYEITYPDGTKQYATTEEDANKLIQENGGGTKEYISMINENKNNSYWNYGDYYGGGYVRSVTGGYQGIFRTG